MNTVFGGGLQFSSQTHGFCGLPSAVNARVRGRTCSVVFLHALLFEKLDH